MNRLDPDQSHHARSVLRLSPGDTVEVFDHAGQIAHATIESTDPVVSVRVEAFSQQKISHPIIVASAVPKGDRADWLVEKLSELGVNRWVPLRTDRSVVHPQGKAKTDRWRRIAEESAKQCRRAGVMELADLTPLSRFMHTIDPSTALLLSTDPSSEPLITLATTLPTILLIGPEGDWSNDETRSMVDRGIKPVSLGPTILRVETAAMLAAGIVAAKGNA